MDTNIFLAIAVVVMGLIFLGVLIGSVLFIAVQCSVLYDAAFPKKKNVFINHRKPGEWEKDMEDLVSDLEEMAKKWK